MTSYWFSRWQPRRHNTTSGFVFDDVTLKIYLQTKFRQHILIHGWDATTSGLETQTSAISEFFHLRFWPDHSNLRATLHQIIKFRLKRESGTAVSDDGGSVTCELRSDKNSYQRPCSVDRTVGDTPSNVCLWRPAAWTNMPKRKRQKRS